MADNEEEEDIDKSNEENNGNTSINPEYEESLQLPSYSPLSMS